MLQHLYTIYNILYLRKCNNSSFKCRLLQFGETCCNATTRMKNVLLKFFFFLIIFRLPFFLALPLTVVRNPPGWEVGVYLVGFVVLLAAAGLNIWKLWRSGAFPAPSPFPNFDYRYLQEKYGTSFSEVRQKVGQPLTLEYDRLGPKQHIYTTNCQVLIWLDFGSRRKSPKKINTSRLM